MRIRPISMLLATALLGAPLAVTATQTTAASAHVWQDGTRLVWLSSPGQAHRLRLNGPDGEVHEFRFDTGEAVHLEARWLDGLYAWELSDDHLAAPPVYRSEQHEAEALASRGTVDAAVSDALSSTWGHFTVQRGHLQLPMELPESQGKQAAGSGAVSTRDSTRDQVIADDLIVQGSICVGIDCVNNESFGFDTVRLKENNVRIHFLDTSIAAGFPARSWELTANDSASGGLDYFAVHDRGTNARPFWIRADAPSHSLHVAPDGRIGMGTSVPAMKLHLTSVDSPGLRLQQAGGSGAYNWDVAGNEANFFIRDVGSNGALPLRIQPGSETNTLTLGKRGHVGIGLWDNQTAARLDIHQTDTNGSLLRIRTGPLAAATTTQLELNGMGDLYIGGTLTQLSSRHAKTNFRSVDGTALLGKVAELPISLWNYLHQPEQVRHLGPTAEDFHAAFGLGERPTQIAPSDLAGVALAAVQVLTHELAERDRQVQTLEARLEQLEQRLLRGSD